MLFLLLSAALSKNKQSVCNSTECVQEVADRTSFVRGDMMRIWATLNINNSLGEPETRYIRWFVTVDDLTVVEIPDKECWLVGANESTVSFSTGSTKEPFTTGDTLYRSDENLDYVIDYYSILVFLDNGVVTKIEFDTTFDTASCKVRSPKFDYWCPKKQTMDSCKAPSDITVKAFIGFVGTDSKKVPLTSAQSMPSTFVKFGVGGIIDDAVNFFNDAKDWFN